MKATHNRACPVCHSDKNENILELNYLLFDDCHMSGQKRLVRCSQCAMLFDILEASPDQLSNYYLKNEHYSTVDVGGTGSISVDNLSRYDRILDRIKPDKSKLIVDVGCGQGGFAAHAKSLGYHVVGVEPSTKSREVARRLGIDVYASAEDLRAAAMHQQIHSYVFSHVAEHVLDPSTFLAGILSGCPQSRVYIEVPDAGSYLSSHAVVWSQMHFEHVNHFSEADILRLASRLSIEIVDVRKHAFSDKIQDVTCLSVVGTAAQTASPFQGTNESCDVKTGDQIARQVADLTDQLPRTTVAIWGMSQYAMLLLGCDNLCARTTRLFDSSPSKIGRTINGIPIGHPREISSLTLDHTLIIPKSNYADQMLSELKGYSFNGAVSII